MLKKLENKFRQYFPKHLKNKHTYLNALSGLSGIEIGGPSFTFSKKGLLPVYKVISELDNCNFSNETLWESKLKEGKTFHFADNKPPGHQYIAEGNHLPMIKDNSYDFVFSCHNLEHFANPVKALYEWKRIVKPNGLLLLVLPNKEKTFDHLRPVTTIEHLMADYHTNMPETDSTHFEDAIELHDINMDPGVTSRSELRERVNRNIESRSVHHHVFDYNLVSELMKQTSYEVLAMDLLQIHIFTLAKNLK